MVAMVTSSYDYYSQKSIRHQRKCMTWFTMLNRKAWAPHSTAYSIKSEIPFPVACWVPEEGLGIDERWMMGGVDGGRSG